MNCNICWPNIYFVIEVGSDYPDDSVDSETRVGPDILCPVAGFLDDPGADEPEDPKTAPEVKTVKERVEEELICTGTDMIVI